MHFFYIDESGDTGSNLKDSDQPIFVLGGISVSDKKWNKTRDAFSAIIDKFFDGVVPHQFELHSRHLLSPEGEGHFKSRDIQERIQLAQCILDLLDDHGHDVHYFAIEKKSFAEFESDYQFGYDSNNLYLCSLDYLLTYINWYVKRTLGWSARGLVFLDQKENLHSEIERIVRQRRFTNVESDKLKWITELSYLIDSKKNPMIQIADLVVMCIKRFLEIDKGYKDNWPKEVEQFYAERFEKINNRVRRKAIVERQGKKLQGANSYVKAIQCKPRHKWKNYYGVGKWSS